MQFRLLQTVNPLLLFLLPIILSISVVSASPTNADNNEMNLFRRDAELYKRACCGDPSDCPKAECGLVCSPNSQNLCGSSKAQVTNITLYSVSIAIKWLLTNTCRHEEKVAVLLAHYDRLLADIFQCL